MMLKRKKERNSGTKKYRNQRSLGRTLFLTVDIFLLPIKKRKLEVIEKSIGEKWFPSSRPRIMV